MKKVLITGATGFVGSHMLDYYLKRKVKLYATKRWRSKMDNVKHIKKGVKWIECDITDIVQDAIDGTSLIHLNGQIKVRDGD